MAAHINARMIRRAAQTAAIACLLAACTAPPPPAATRPSVPAHDAVASIRAAGEQEASVIDVAPLRDPGVTALQDAAHADERAGRYSDAATKLDQARKLSPDSPDLLQDRAEVAVRLNDFTTAENLARHAWSIGPKLGALCARNQQTIVEVRLQAGDQPGAAIARKALQACHKAGISRY